MALVVGIDVGGAKKGHHGVGLADGGRIVLGPWIWPDAESALSTLAVLPGLAVVAIDAPPRAVRLAEATREAEREVFRLGLKIQWTRAQGQAPQEWMVNGERLWTRLAEGLPGVRLVETFPTAVAVLSAPGAELSVPLALFSGEAGRARKDVLDALLASWAALRVLEGRHTVAGEGSEDGEIVF